jgi:asparagine synthase (glutamine-hydrolysing)
MQPTHAVRQVIDLTDSGANVIFNMSADAARARVAAGDVEGVRAIDGCFALVGREANVVRMARSLSVPMRFFIAKRHDGPMMIVAHRIDTIKEWLDREGLAEQFHPTYTRMVPAHYLTEIALLGCPDPNPTYRRYFTPSRNRPLTDLTEIGSRYIGAAAEVIAKWLRQLPGEAPIGVCFSGGVDSGAVFLLTYHSILRLGLNPSRLKAFVLSAETRGQDARQAREFLEALDLGLFLESIEVPVDGLDPQAAIRAIEDYKPLDIQAGTMMHALCHGIRARYPEWRHLIDGDGGDENLKDYPIEENPELTIRSVLNNRLLYHEGWGIDSVKHSLVYSGGLSRSCTRGFGPASAFGFRTFSPFTLPDVVEVAEGIPFIALTNWEHERLYALKGEIVSRGVEAVTGLKMPVFKKRRFQHGVLDPERFAARFPHSHADYRRTFQALFDA